LGWLARGLGGFGSELGEASYINQDYRAKQQQMALEAARQKLQELLLPLQMQELQSRIREIGQPKPAGLVTTRGGGTAGATFTPGAGYSLQTLETGADPESAKRQIINMKQNAPKEFQGALQAHIDAIDAGADPLKELDAAQKDMSTSAAKSMPTGSAQNRALSEAMDAYERGDMVTYAAKLKEAGQLAGAVKAQAPTQWSLRVKAVTDQGPEGDVARAVLKAQEEEQIRLVKARGLAFGQGRLYALNDYIKPDGTLTAMTGFEYLAARDRGEQLTPTGRLSPNIVVGYQRLQSEAAPALAGVRANLKAFDNASDKAIFARVLGTSKPDYGNEGAWIHNMLDQVATNELSPEGQQLKISLTRLADTMGLVRSSMALPATEQAMNLTMSLLPGKSTPNSKYALDQLNQLQGIIAQSANLPIFSGMPNTLANPSAAPPNVPPPPGFTQKVGP
jgi:hypothetical protein